MNLYDRQNMSGPDVGSADGTCAICHMAPATERHHIVPRSRGGAKGPTIAVCGSGNCGGCHGMLHAHLLHLRWRGGRWEVLETERPTKVDEAMRLGGWRELLDVT